MTIQASKKSAGSTVSAVPVAKTKPWHMQTIGNNNNNAGNNNPCASRRNKKYLEKNTRCGIVKGILVWILKAHATFPHLRFTVFTELGDLAG